MGITLDLETGLFQPYRKPGDKPLYVSAHSNHPTQILKNLPKGIEIGLTRVNYLDITLDLETGLFQP